MSCAVNAAGASSWIRCPASSISVTEVLGINSASRSARSTGIQLSLTPQITCTGSSSSIERFDLVGEAFISLRNLTVEGSLTVITCPWLHKYCRFIVAQTPVACTVYVRFNSSAMNPRWKLNKNLGVLLDQPEERRTPG